MLYQLIKTLVLPPGSIIALLTAGLLLSRWRRRTGLAVVAAACVLLYALSIGATTRQLGAGWEPRVPDPVSAASAAGAGALVVLGAGRNTGAPEYPDADSASALALVRLRYAAYLHRATGLPVLVSGGRVLGSEARSEAELMAEALERDFRVPVRWREGGSRTTSENAQGTAVTLLREGVDTIVLVTHAAHMPRAESEFLGKGLTVVPAPTYYFAHPGGPLSARDFLPQAGAFGDNVYLLHERIGSIWYALRRALAGVPD